MTNCALPPPSDICPGHDDVLPHLIALLPRGRAWRTEAGGVRYRFLSAIARVFAFAEQRICAAMEEFFCATAAETLDVWAEEYSLYDGCDPWPDLCAKVRAYDDPRCEFWVSAAARAGWAILSTDATEPCGATAGDGIAGCAAAGPGVGATWTPACVDYSNASGATAGCAMAGDASPGRGLVGGELLLRVSLAHSPAYVAAPQSLAGAMGAGDGLSCPPDLTGLYCLMARILPAHVKVFYEVING